jgi:hypothetical protein
VAAYVSANTYYWVTNVTGEFAAGTIGTSVYSSANGFPTSTDPGYWPLVGFRYSEGSGQTFAISPTNASNFVNGVWSGNVAVLQVATNMVLNANDGAGHFGSSNPFEVIYSNSPPIITMQPVGLALPVGSTATFTVGALGSQPLSYFWRLNGAPIAGATNTNYSITNIQLANSGEMFSCLVSNAYGTVTSSIAPLTVTLSNLVQNFGFELGSFADWTSSGNFEFCYVTSNAPYVHSGMYGAEVGPSGTLGYISQSLATSVGQMYQVGCWLYCDGETPNEFSVSWNGSTFFDQTNFASTLSLPGQWTNIQFLASATSTSTVLSLGFRDDPSYFGLDDITVYAVMPPVFKGVTVANGIISITWGAEPGLLYQLEYTTNLAQGNWTALNGALSTTNSTLTATDTISASMNKFYRLLVEP